MGQHLGIAFDLDGVLIDSAPCHRAAFAEVFEEIGIKGFDYSPYAGWRTPEVVADVLKKAQRSADQELIAKLAAEKSRRARVMIAASQPYNPGFPTVLEALKAEHRLALASSGGHASVQGFLKLSGRQDLFDVVLSGDDVPLAKPDPEIYSRSRHLLDVQSDRFAVVEDALAGVEAGLGAGARVIGVVGTTTAEALLNAGASVVIHNLHELPGALERIWP